MQFLQHLVLSFIIGLVTVSASKLSGLEREVAESTSLLGHETKARRARKSPSASLPINARDVRSISPTVPDGDMLLVSTSPQRPKQINPPSFNDASNVVSLQGQESTRSTGNLGLFLEDLDGFAPLDGPKSNWRKPFRFDDETTAHGRLQALGIRSPRQIDLTDEFKPLPNNLRRDPRYVGYGSANADEGGFASRMTNDETNDETTDGEIRQGNWIRRNPGKSIAIGVAVNLLAGTITSYEICKHMHNSSFCKPF